MSCSADTSNPKRMKKNKAKTSTVGRRVSVDWLIENYCSGTSCKSGTPAVLKSLFPFSNFQHVSFQVGPVFSGIFEFCSARQILRCCPGITMALPTMSCGHFSTTSCLPSTKASMNAAQVNGMPTKRPMRFSPKPFYPSTKMMIMPLSKKMERWVLLNILSHGTWWPSWFSSRRQALQPSEIYVHMWSVLSILVHGLFLRSFWGTAGVNSKSMELRFLFHSRASGSMPLRFGFTIITWCLCRSFFGKQSQIATLGGFCIPRFHLPKSTGLCHGDMRS